MKLKREQAVVCDACGFIDGHRATQLMANEAEAGCPPDLSSVEELGRVARCEKLSLERKEEEDCRRSGEEVDIVFERVVDRSGMGLAENNKAQSVLSERASSHSTQSAFDEHGRRVFFPAAGAQRAGTLSARSRQRVDLREQFVCFDRDRKSNLTAPVGVNGRNGEHSGIIEQFGWEPSIRLREGLAKTCAGIASGILVGCVK
jgi:hypothetical protein